ncbi:MAG: sugar O-acetyltransferase [Oscillospiraceae bacterium]|nr:sugar O-acetyltransferase [Oscillospiraceae bacterium]
MEKRFLGGYQESWFPSVERNRPLVRAYNTIDPLDIEGKYKILRDLLGEVHEKTIIEPPFYCDNGQNIFLGDNFYANYNLTILDGDRVTIGKNVVIGPNVTISADAHPVHWKSRTDGDGFPITTAPVTIEDNVWIGAGCIILMGVTIGAGAVIGAGSIVTKDIPPNCIAFGSPCKKMREITDEDIVSWDDLQK